jgi:hypothetical protein
MKRLIAILAVLTVAALASASPASALNTPTCGTGGASGNITDASLMLIHLGPPTYWRGDWRADCGVGSTVNWFVQHTTDGGNTWTAVISKSFTTTAWEAGGAHPYEVTNTTVTCSNTGYYRLKVNTATDSSTQIWDNTNCDG